MSIRRAVATGALLAALVAGCDQGIVSPSVPIDGSGSPPAGGGSEAPGDSTSPVVGQLLGPWRRSPIVLDDGHIAIFSDACAKRAREDLGDGPAEFPTAVVDAQGMALAIVILSDDVNAVECLLDIDPAGNAIASTVNWFGGDAIEPVDGTNLSVVSYLHAMDGGRTIAFGRIGPKAVKAKLGFDDASVIQAADTNGWWATWWRGNVAAATFAATDSKDIVVGHAPKPPEASDPGQTTGNWWIDPSKPAPKPTSTTIHALVTDRQCSSGHAPIGRVLPAIVEISEAMVVVRFRVWGPGGTAQDCQGAPPAPVELVLPDPLGNRRLLDGGTNPPRDATTPP